MTEARRHDVSYMWSLGEGEGYIVTPFDIYLWWLSYTFAFQNTWYDYVLRGYRP